MDCKKKIVFYSPNGSFSFFSLSSLTSLFSLISSLSQVVRQLWSGDCGLSWVVVRWSGSWVRLLWVLILGYGLWFDSRGSWSDGLMVVGGGNDGLMADDCAPMGIGHGSPIYWLRGVSRIWWRQDGGLWV